VGYFPKIIEAEKGFGNPVKVILLNAKKQYLETLSRIYPEPHNSLLAGILVGAKRNLPQGLKDQLAKTSTSHIVAISGFNITIIVQTISKLLQRFGRRTSFIVSLLSIIMFVIITGAQASVVRAGIMGVLALIALNAGRLYAVTNALVFAAALMLIVNPLTLHFDVGFQLSFLALIGLVFLQPKIEVLFAPWPKFLTNYLLPALCAQIFTLPVLLLNFDQLSVIGIVTNVFVVPAIPLLMLFGFLSGLIGLFSIVLAQPMYWLTWILISYIIEIIKFSSLIPMSSITVNNFSPVFVVIYYLLLSIIILFFYNSNLIHLWKPKQ